MPDISCENLCFFFKKSGFNYVEKTALGKNTVVKSDFSEITSEGLNFSFWQAGFSSNIIESHVNSVKTGIL